MNRPSLTPPAEMIEQMEASIVRLFDAAGDVVGTGFVACEGHVLTCAHVVARALGAADAGSVMPEGDVHLDFPLVAQGVMVAARPMRVFILRWHFFRLALRYWESLRRRLFALPT